MVKHRDKMTSRTEEIQTKRQTRQKDFQKECHSYFYLFNTFLTPFRCKRDVDMTYDYHPHLKQERERWGGGGPGGREREREREREK
jgi:hypothetical protein